MKKILLYIGCALMLILSSCKPPVVEDLSKPVVVVIDTIGGYPCIRYEHENRSLALSMSWAVLNVGADSVVAPGVRIPWGENMAQLNEHSQQQGRYMHYDYTENCYHLMNLSSGVKREKRTDGEVLVRYFGADSLTLALVENIGIGEWLHLMQDSLGIDSTARMDSIYMLAHEPYNHYFNRNLARYVCHPLYDWWKQDSLVRTPVDGLRELLPADDLATIEWGAAWQMPTAKDWRELYANCRWEWVDETPADSLIDWDVTYKVGYKVMAKTPMIQLGDTIVPRDSVYIFLPVTGYCSGYGRKSQVFQNEFAEGYYWSKSLFNDVYADKDGSQTAYGDDAQAFAMSFTMHSYMVTAAYRNLGMAIRPVTKLKAEKE